MHRDYWLTKFGLQNVEQEEQDNPNHIDKVPVDFSRFNTEMALTGIVTCLPRSPQHRQHQQQPKQHVETMKPRQNVKRAGEEVGGQAKFQMEILVQLSGQKYGSHSCRNQEPFLQSWDIVFLNGRIRIVNYKATGNQDDGIQPWQQ